MRNAILLMGTISMAGCSTMQGQLCPAPTDPVMCNQYAFVDHVNNQTNDPRWDLNGDGIVNVDDVPAWREACVVPAVNPPVPEVSIEELDAEPEAEIIDE